MPTFPRIKQQQIFPGVNRARAQAIKVTTSEAIAAGDIIVGTGYSSGVMTVHKAVANVITKCRGPFFIADYGAASGVTTDLAIPWKIVTGVNTGGAAVGDAVWLDKTTAGGYAIGAVPAVTTNGNGFELAVKIGRVLAVHASTGVIMLNPGIADGAPLVGRVTLLTGGTTTVAGFTAELDAAPVVVNSGSAAAGGDANDCTARIVNPGLLTIESKSGVTTAATYMIQG